MVIDTSALIAILFSEPDRDLYIDAIEKASVKLLSAVNALECAVVAEARKGPAAGREFDLLVHCAHIEIAPMDRELVEESRRVWREYGKGNYPARVQFLRLLCAGASPRLRSSPFIQRG